MFNKQDQEDLEEFRSAKKISLDVNDKNSP